jgi:ribosomal protein L20
VANQQVMKALRYSYVGRKQKKEFSEEFGLVESMQLLD